MMMSVAGVSKVRVAWAGEQQDRIRCSNMILALYNNVSVAVYHCRRYTVHGHISILASPSLYTADYCVPSGKRRATSLYRYFLTCVGVESEAPAVMGLVHLPLTRVTQHQVRGQLDMYSKSLRL